MSDSAITAAAAEHRRTVDIEALTGAAAFVRGVHSLIWVRGADAVSFLDALISQSIAPAEPGSVQSSLLLTPQGKMRSYLWVLRSAEDEVGLITQATTHDTVVTDLTRFRFRVDAEIEAEERPIVTLVGPRAEDALVAADVVRPGEGWLQTPDGLAANVPFWSAAYPRYVLVGDAAVAIGQSAAEAGLSAYEAVRIAAPEALGNVDFDDSTISHELGPVAQAVDFDKGCYLGQELVARIDSRGRVTRRLRHLLSDGRDISGALLRRDGVEVGAVTSAAPGTDGGYLGLGLVRHVIEPGQVIEAAVGDTIVPVTVKSISVLDT